MLLWLLSCLDVFVVLAVGLTQLDVWVNTFFLLFSAGYLVFKSIMWWGGAISSIDLVIAFYILLLLIGIRSVVSYIIILYLGQKIVVSFIKK